MEELNLNQSQKHDSGYHIHKEEDLMRGEVTPKDRLENQIRLAFELAQESDPNLKIDSIDDTQKSKEELREERNKIMELWTQEFESEIWGMTTYSKLYRLFEEEPLFKENKRNCKSRVT